MALEITRICDICGARTVMQGEQLEYLKVTSDLGNVRVIVDPNHICHPCALMTIKSALSTGNLKLTAR